MTNEILNNYNKILNEINNIKKEYNITHEILLLPVSKTRSLDEMKILKDNNIKLFGENYVNELSDKKANDNELNFHLIGHLQTNKVKAVLDNVCMIESVDSIKLANIINKEAEKKNINVNILIEVNVACEETKFGFKAEEVEDAIKEISNLKNITVKGLMTSAPLTDTPSDNEKYFTKLKNLYDKIKNENDSKNNNIKFDTLSMGMTNDFREAIKCGSTEIRIGTAIFGERNYNK